MVNLKQKLTLLHFVNIWAGWRRWLLLLASISTILLLVIIRIQTDTEYAFASLARTTQIIGL